MQEKESIICCSVNKEIQPSCKLFCGNSTEPRYHLKQSTLVEFSPLTLQNMMESYSLQTYMMTRCTLMLPELNNSVNYFVPSFPKNMLLSITKIKSTYCIKPYHFQQGILLTALLDNLKP